MKVINYRSSGDKLFVATFQEEQIGIYAAKQTGALQRAVEYFRPRKRERELIQIQLKE